MIYSCKMCTWVANCTSRSENNMALNCKKYVLAKDRNLMPNNTPKIAQTVGDQVRSMSDKELADWMYTHDCITAEKGRLNKDELLAYFQRKIKP